MGYDGSVKLLGTRWQDPLMTTIPRPPVFKVSLIQLLVLLALTFGAFWFSLNAALSVFLEGCVRFSLRRGLPFRHLNMPEQTKRTRF